MMSQHTPGPCPNTTHCYNCRINTKMLSALKELVAEADDHPGWDGHGCPDTYGFRLARALLKEIEG